MWIGRCFGFLEGNMVGFLGWNGKGVYGKWWTMFVWVGLKGWMGWWKWCCVGVEGVGLLGYVK